MNSKGYTEVKPCIYQILCVKSQKRYIGSAQGARKRWLAHLRELKNNTHHSPHLQNSWNKHKGKGFNFEVLEYCKQEDILIREQYYLDKYESWNPKRGYNICKIAGSHIDVCKYGNVTLKRISDGKIYTEISVRMFKQEHNLGEGSIRGLIRGIIKTADGWTLPNYELEFYVLTNLQGESFKFYSVKDFVQEHFNIKLITGQCEKNSTYNAITRILRNKSGHYKGWSVPDVKKPKFYYIQSPENKIYSFCQIDPFARKFNLVNVTVRNILIGKTKCFKGWKLPTESIENAIFCDFTW